MVFSFLVQVESVLLILLTTSLPLTFQESLSNSCSGAIIFGSSDVSSVFSSTMLLFNLVSNFNSCAGKSAELAPFELARSLAAKLLLLNKEALTVVMLETICFYSKLFSFCSSEFKISISSLFTSSGFRGDSFKSSDIWLLLGEPTAIDFLFKDSAGFCEVLAVF